tara:strand:+ start:17 stop:961 length:945 start_codon:yes stop_codon:yes gene_type:complete
LQILTSTAHSYELITDWGIPPKRQYFKESAAVAVDAKDNVWVFNIPTNELLIFNNDGNLRKIWPHKYDNIHGIDFDASGNVYLVNRNYHQILKYTSNGDLIMSLGDTKMPSETGYSLEIGRRTSWKHPVLNAGGPFNVPSGVRIARNGDIYVSDGYANCQIHRFSSSGQLIQSWGSPGKLEAGQFHLIHGLFIDSKNRILVCDRMNNRIQIFDMNGKFIGFYNGLLMPSKIHETPDGHYVITEHVGRISIIDDTGKFLCKWGNGDGGVNKSASGMFRKPHGCAVDSKGNIYIGNVIPDGDQPGSGDRIIKIAQI